MNETKPQADIASPCNKICILDSAGNFCTGCFRTLDEIAKWSELSAGEKNAVLASLANRRAKFGGS